MRILAIGDFHGKFPVKLQKLAKGVDLVISVGDYCSFTNRDLFFEYSYHKDTDLWEAVGKKKVKEGILKDLKSGENILKKLNVLKVPVLTVIGNTDYTRVHDTFDVSSGTSRKWKWGAQDFFKPMIKKYGNVRRFDYGSAQIEGLNFIGAYGHTFPGIVKSRNYKKYRAILEKLFKKFQKKDIIFVSHNMPYDCKLDKIRDKNAPMVVRGKHYGSKLIRRIINKYQPILAIGGHMHENQGKCKIGKTLVVNPGAAVDGRAAIIEFDEGRGKVKSVRFVK